MSHSSPLDADDQEPAAPDAAVPPPQPGELPEDATMVFPAVREPIREDPRPAAGADSLPPPQGEPIGTDGPPEHDDARRPLPPDQPYPAQHGYPQQPYDAGSPGPGNLGPGDHGPGNHGPGPAGPGNALPGNQPLGNQPLGNQPLGNQPLGHQGPGAAGPGQYYAPAHAGPQGYAPPAPPASPPKPEDLLVPDRSPVTDQPATWGWRGRLNRFSGGLLKLRAGEAEIRIRQAISDIQQGFSRPMTVVVVQPKGGAGKTPTTIGLAAALGSNRGGYVVGWDNNETRGTLAVRVSNPDSQRATVWDLLSDLAAFERYDARVGDLSRYVRAQPDAHFDALVSDDNPGNMAQIGENEFNRLHTVLQRFYRMIAIDTGNNVRSPNWQAAVNAADLIVVVSTYQRDVGYSGSWVLDHLAQTGREELARNAITVLTAADPTTDKTVRGQLLEHFHARTRAVCEIPYDPEIAHGGPIRWNELRPETRHAWIVAGAKVVNSLAHQDRQALAARH